MHWSLFAFAALALMFAHGLKLPTSGSRWLSMLAFLVGLFAAAFAIKFFASQSDIGRTTDFDRVTNHAVITASQDDTPLIVFTGASYSRNALDPERLTIALQERGFNAQVLSLSMEAASMMERAQHLQQFIDQSGRVPDMVFIEVAQAFDYKVAFMFGNSKFNARAIEQFDLKNTFRTLSGLAERACGGTVDCIKDTGFLGLHAALNVLNVGLIGGGERAEDAGTLAAYDPQFEQRLESNPADLKTILPLTEQAVPKWATAYRLYLEDYLLDQGVSTVGWYQPPVQPAGQRMYVEALCANELKHAPCIGADDPNLLHALNGNYWFDRDHLLDDGAAIYVNWLADKLIESGVLEDQK